MPTKKQRRRRQKDRRHEYEFVYVDDEGREVEVDSEELGQASPRRNGKRDAKRQPQKGRDGRPVRQVAAPSWRKVGKRALIFFPLIEIPAVVYLGFWFLMQVLNGTMALAVMGDSGGVAWWAHVGGFAAGMALAPLLRRRQSYPRAWRDQYAPW